MSTIACPNCGKPLRAGARFCGNCGATLPAPVRPAAAPPPSDVKCPHCGNPIREGARFCGSCGKSVDLEPEAPGDGSPAGAPVTPAATAPSAVAVTAPGSSVTAPDGAAAQGSTAVPLASQQETRRAMPAPARPADTSPGRSASGPHPALSSNAPGAPAKARPAPGRRIGVWLALVGVLACVGLLAGAYFLADQMDWLQGLPVLGGASPTIAALAPAATMPATAPVATTAPSLAPVVVSPAVATSEPTVPATSQPATPAPTETAALPLPTLSAAPLQATTASAAPPVAPSQAPSEVYVLFDDTFDNGLAGYWRTWGSPRPLIDRGPGDAWLSLKALDIPTSGGITSRRDFVVFNEPGAEIEFEAQLDGNYPQGILLFDWDPLDQFDRGPDNGDAGLIHLELRKDQVRVQTAMSGERCSHEVTGQVKHTYAVRIEADQVVNLYIDGQLTPCSISDMGLDPMAGSISFSGLGWITRVKVAMP